MTHWLVKAKSLAAVVALCLLAPAAFAQETPDITACLTPGALLATGATTANAAATLKDRVLACQNINPKSWSQHFSASADTTTFQFPPALDALLDQVTTTQMQVCIGSRPCELLAEVRKRVLEVIALERARSICRAANALAWPKEDHSIVEDSLTVGSATMPDVLVGRYEADTRTSRLFRQISLMVYVLDGSIASMPAANAPVAACDAACRNRTREADAALALFFALKGLQADASTTCNQGNFKESRRVSVMQGEYLRGADGRYQWPQEMWLNSVVFPAQTDSGNRWVPDKQALTFLHPGVGATLYDTGGDALKIAAIVEVIGYSRWNWTAEGKRENVIGASLIAEYHGSDTANDWGYGVLVRTPFNGLNIAWTRHDSPTGHEDSVLFSMSISGFTPDLSSLGKK